MKTENKRRIVLVGATGLVGSFLLDLLLEDENTDCVISLVRKPTGRQHPKLQEMAIDFDRLFEYDKEITGEAVFCCLGTTIKKAKSKQNFRRVDYLYPLELAKIARENHVPQFNIITAVGADKNSLFFYNKVKGEIEEALKYLHFENLNIFRPSLLLGERDEQRFGEKVGANISKIINPIMIGGFKKYRGIKAADVALAMHIISQSSENLIKIYQSDELFDIAHENITL